MAFTFFLLIFVQRKMIFINFAATIHLLWRKTHGYYTAKIPITCCKSIVCYSILC